MRKFVLVNFLLGITLIYGCDSKAQPLREPLSCQDSMNIAQSKGRIAIERFERARAGDPKGSLMREILAYETLLEGVLRDCKNHPEAIRWVNELLANTSSMKRTLEAR